MKVDSLLRALRRAAENERRSHALNQIAKRQAAQAELLLRACDVAVGALHIGNEKQRKEAAERLAYAARVVRGLENEQ